MKPCEQKHSSLHSHTAIRPTRYGPRPSLSSSIAHKRFVKAMSSNLKLFQPIQVGDMALSHRVVMCPLTRSRAHASHAHSDLAIEYYSQRASVPGTLLISEATFICAKAGGFRHVPGIWSTEQIAAWKRITDAVHIKGSFFFSSFGLWAVRLIQRPAPRPLTKSEIREYVEAFGTAASNAVHGAGFDGVEIHGANGYLVEQFLKDGVNTRTDEYGGSVENRCRFALEVVNSVVCAVGASKTAIRFSPWGDLYEERMKNPVPTFAHLTMKLKELYPDFAYIHVVEPAATGDRDRRVLQHESNNFIRDIWAPKALISAGGYTRKTALAVAERTGELIAFGRPFIGNPDLPLRLRYDIPLAASNRKTWYTHLSPKGYIDYPRADEDPRVVQSKL
ncbi:putative NADPH dehydrogenase C5H10.10 [Grifola frondosa]|uniref:Putative NADPH dehydrogenase C5H10.10 n=1 Tax=Grifola frondosa TaxID=5627 RepID=A0A1C7MLD4_GRIFR|nr:putative NADPH dehydrogenase C5H10.10 [Grifola frondosa]